MVKNKLIKKVLLFIGLGCAVVGGSLAVNHIQKQKNGQGFIDNIVDVIQSNQFKGDLERPQNLSYNHEQKKLTWDAVENAESYSVKIELNGVSYKSYEVKENQISFNDFDEILYQGDKICFEVSAKAEKYYNSLLSEYEYTVQQSNEKANMQVAEKMKSFVRSNNITSIDYLSFDESSASGIIKYEKNGESCIQIYNFSSENFKDELNHKNFYENIYSLIEFKFSEENQFKGKIIDYDVSDIVSDKLQIDLKNVENIVLYQREDVNRNCMFDIFVQVKQDDKIINKNFTVALIGSFYGQTVERVFNDIRFNDDSEFSISQTLSFEQKENQNNTYLQQLKHDLGLTQSKKTDMESYIR